MKKLLFVTWMTMLAGACGQKAKPCPECPKAAVPTAVRAKAADPLPPADMGQLKMEDKMEQGVAERAIGALLTKYGDREKERISRGVLQASRLWDVRRDGDVKAFEAFCAANFVPDGDARERLFERLHRNLEIMLGHNARVRLDLSRIVQLDVGEILPVDKIFAEFNPSAHLHEDLYTNRIAFITILNFPNFTLVEKKTAGPAWTRRQWAYARMGDVFTSRVPAKVRQDIDTAFAQADDYISNYNIYMGKVVDADGKSLFPADMKLITHWNLRDELKSRYADARDGLKAQKQIYSVMKRIIDQSIPEAVVNKGDFTWNPDTNKIFKDGKEHAVSPEPDTRYEFLLKTFHAVVAEDPYSPGHPTYIQRVFDRELEYTEKEIEALFVKLLSSPQVAKVGKLIEQRLGRKLEPFDIWYDGFKTRSSIPDAQLSAQTRKLYPTPAAFHADMPRMLGQLGFAPDKALFLQTRIEVDPARGAGHAWGAEMRTDKSHLRTRVSKDGMDYKGYNIAVHELGHNVEQTLTIHDVDNYMMKGVPNTAFTEAWAFIFQRRDLSLLGVKEGNPLKDQLGTLDNFWSTYEIMGVSLVDMKVWRWLYAHPAADRTQLKQAVIAIAMEVWNQYFAPVFGARDETLLAIYSHMIDYPLYLPAYPIGHVAEFQLEQFIRGKKLGIEMARICAQGRLVPDLWMQGAVGATLSVDPTLAATEEALKVVVE
ncbi:MAG: hypothetical protein CVU65_04790 [Deltaproteobacteria bacterium HGW-Deltaproteobacteria-22]|nr:MAG: hypothetical protein CVU65_04790 [Deltaproteobacteria bacterium HGW-Deltaproteobacteria-22]